MNQDIKYYIYDTVIGKITITGSNNRILEIKYGECKKDNIKYMKNEIIENAASELNEYLNGRREVFSIPLMPVGTEFQRLVWSALKEIPYGMTKSYKEIAEIIGKPKAYRAVGMANNKNPIMIMIPCHRVIGADGSLTGYACGINVKQSLLELERKKIMRNT